MVIFLPFSAQLQLFNIVFSVLECKHEAPDQIICVVCADFYVFNHTLLPVSTAGAALRVSSCLIWTVISFTFVVALEEIQKKKKKKKKEWNAEQK